ncbi:MAG: nucleotidyltransferase family protein [Oscillospiraceae bacterium]|nr:nucleotidyltransferase family protein [Oscillospiraceae bacterium]MDD4413151.1 nucleotidyltransferase family protein [Oscillospiraceae bacterium]
MNSSDIFFLDLLSAFINKTEPDVCRDIDWNEIMHLAALHSVGGIIGYMVNKLPKDKKPDAVITEKFNNLYYSTITTLSNKEYSMLNLINEFDKEQIPHLLMKGYVVKEYYPVKELRTFGDIDILIKKNDRQKAHELMLKLGYNVGQDHGAVWVYSRGYENYEIHTQLISEENTTNSIVLDFFDKAWDNASAESGKYTYYFTPEFHFIYLLQHIAKHMKWQGAGIRMFMDIAVYLKCNTTLDWGYLWSELEKLNLKLFTENVLALCTKWFHIALPFEPRILPDQFYQDITGYVLSAGTFGFYGRNQAAFCIRNEIEQGRSNSVKGSPGWRTFRKFLFPSYSSLEEKYKILSGRPYLLPVIWVARVFRVFSPKRRAAMKHAKNIMTGSKEALEQYNLFEQLGLNR